MRGHQQGDLAALQRIREFHPEFRSLTDAQIGARAFRLSDAQLAIAREYTFESWPKLRASIESNAVPDEGLPLAERIADPMFREAVRLIDAGDIEGLRGLLLQRPSLVRQRVYFNASDYFGRPGLLQFVAQNPIRQETMPNAIVIAKTIIDAGAVKADLDETLNLVATGRVSRENRLQVALIDLLCEHGAEMARLTSVLAHGEFEAAEALLRHGGELALSVASAFDWRAEFERLLPSASDEERHLALAFSAQFGRVVILRKLLEAGEDPNRYNPLGAHSHSTPLHQAVIHGHAEAVRALLRAGARTDVPDTLFRGKPIDWAEHAQLPEMVSLLREF